MLFQLEPVADVVAQSHAEFIRAAAVKNVAASLHSNLSRLGVIGH